MTAANQAILTQFEELGMSPEEIADSEGLDLAVVKSVLAQFSTYYRKEIKEDDKLNFTDDELVRANSVITEIAQYAEDERTRLRAAMYIRDDKKGRLDAVKNMAGLNFNVMAMQEAMAKMRLAQKRAHGVIEAEVISKELSVA